MDQVDIGFRFFHEDWGKGYATETAIIALALGFEHWKVKEIIGRAAKENKASIAVLEKIGMCYWKEDTCKGMDTLVYYSRL